jgi:hypothetical protein
MRLVVLALLLTLVPSGCATFGQTVWPSTVKCTAQVTGAIVPQVEDILRNGLGPSIDAEATSMLEKLAADNGAELVACVVQQLVSQWTQPTARALREVEPPSPNEDAAARGHSFLKQKGVAVVAGPPS